MNLSGKNLWQVGSGGERRSYGAICCKFDVMLAGPGNFGECPEENYAALGSRERSALKAFGKAERGDIVVLRRGTREVISVGEVVDDEPQQLSAFTDVDGWNVPHVRRVRWFCNTGKYFPPRTFGSQGRGFCAIGVLAVREWVGSLEIDSEQYSRPLARLPEGASNLNFSDLRRRLSGKRFSNERLEELMQTLEDLVQFAQWYKHEENHNESRPSESETVAHLVVPLLYALGWSRETVAIEWKRIDAALFEGIPTNDSTLVCVLEAKKLNESVFAPFTQAEKYALKPERQGCNRLIVTDGIRYAVREKEGEDFKLSAYFNILDIRERYPIFGCEGAIDAILRMAPVKNQ